ncbi:MAG: putative toxin-antitoxin system toxin component, PIN family [Gallionellaceae bacterium]|nr:putative toxin-antitoxin system toxin component, PIN family [Gallionellaceae bacterium]
MRIVIDTNVLLSGLLWHGTPHTLFNQVRAGTVELVMSQALLEEFAETITRRKFAAILQRTTRTPERILNELQALAEMVVAPPLPQPVCRDPDDDAVLACALVAQADLIVSGDADLLVLKQFQGMPIVTAAQAVKHIATP